MTPNLKKHIARLGENLWKPYREDTGMVSECADLLNYWPEDEERPEGTGPVRYIACAGGRESYSPMAAK